MNLYHTLAQHATDGKLFFRVWDDTSPSRLGLTGTAATSGFKCHSPLTSLLTPMTYPAATHLLSLEKEHSSVILQHSILRHISLDHGDIGFPCIDKNDTSGLPDVSPWISVSTNLDAAVVAIGQRLREHPQRRQHLTVIRRADIVEKWTMVLPHIQAYQARASGAGTPLKQYLKKCAKRATKEGEYIFYGRVFLSSILFDLGWTAERPGLDLPSKFVSDHASSLPRTWRNIKLIPALSKTPAVSSVAKSTSKVAKKVRRKLRAEHAARLALLSKQERMQPDNLQEYGWAEWMLDVIRRRGAKSNSEVEEVEMNLIEL